MAVSEGLVISETAPSWVECLGKVHNRPFHLRYSEEIHGIVTPSIQLMVSELAKLLKTVDQ
jgi:hypothetical protein